MTMLVKQRMLTGILLICLFVVPGLLNTAWGYANSATPASVAKTTTTINGMGAVREPIAILWSRPTLENKAISIQAAADPGTWAAQLTVQQRRDLVGKADTIAIYGEQVTILEQQGEWVKVAVVSHKTHKNKQGYPGWMLAKQIISDEKFLAEQANSPEVVIAVPRTKMFTDAGLTAVRGELTWQVRLPLVAETGKAVEVRLPDGTTAFLERQAVKKSVDLHYDGLDAVRQAKQFLGTKYLWAGASVDGFDCSGLTFRVYQSQGITIPRDADEQASAGIPVTKDELLPGDLLFFATNKGQGAIHHVGIYSGKGMMIHAPNSSSVIREEAFDTGLFGSEFWGARRYKQGLQPSQNELSGTTVATRMAHMSLEQKVGQVMIGFFSGPVLSPELEHQLRELHLGGVILYSITGNIESSPQVAQLVSDMQRTAREAGNAPLFISIDQEGGRVTRISRGVTPFPGNMALGATGSLELAGEAARVMARELKLLGINMNFAPVLDVNSNPLNPIIGIRSFGSSPEEVARFGTAVVNSYNEEGVIATAKHFPGHGDTSLDSHLALPVVNRSLKQLEAVELLPFRAAAKTVPAIMTAHIIVPDIDQTRPATLSSAALGLLRHELGFQGLIITDSMSMAAIAKHWTKEEAAIQAFLAGVDILLYGADVDSKPHDQALVHAALVKAVRDGRIPESRLDESVRRVLMMKQRFSITGEEQESSWKGQLASADHIAVAEQVARESLTLTRYKEALLPLTARVKIPIFWPEENKEKLAPLLTELPQLEPHYFPLRAAAAHREQARMIAAKSPVVLAGTYNLASQTEWKQLVNSLDGSRTIVLAVRSPYDLMFLPDAAVCIAAYDDNYVTMTMLGKVLTGELAPRGRLPVVIPTGDSKD